MQTQSKKFLSNPDAFVADMVDSYNYDTCHIIKDYDASKCAEDCEKAEKDPFATECTKNGGLHKCCIRLVFWIL